jgi:alpha-ketoglutarate-dependent taurine dioxygenase
MTTLTRYEVRPASPRLGAEIVGLDLTAGDDEAAAEALREDFRAHKVLVFRDQHLSPDQHVEAVRIFDEPFDHPTAVHRHKDNRLVYVFDVPKAGGAALWHVGGLWRNPPFSIESLSYQVVPEVGGHTLWADLQAAYDDLSEPFKQLLESVSAVYDGNAGSRTASGAGWRPCRPRPGGCCC